MSTTQKTKPKTAMASLLDALHSAKNTEELQTGNEEKVEKKSDLSIGFNHLLGEPLSKEPKSADSNLAPILKNLSTSDCIPWKYADRPEDEMGDIDALAQSINEYGQQEPILVRPSKTMSGKYEIIFGHRRWKACRLANKELMAMVKQMSDQEAALFQKEENENREDLSDFSRAQNYRQLLEEQVFASENELAKHLGIRRQTLNDIFAYIRVPEDLRVLIPKFKKLSRKLVVKLATLSKTKEKLTLLKQLAPKIDLGKITSGNIENELRKVTIDEPQEVKEIQQLNITNPKTGKVAFKIKQAFSGALNINIAREYSNMVSQDDVVKVISDLLKIE